MISQRVAAGVIHKSFELVLYFLILLFYWQPQNDSMETKKKSFFFWFFLSYGKMKNELEI